MAGVSAVNGHLTLSNFMPNSDTSKVTVELRNGNSYAVDAINGCMALLWYINDALIS